MLYFMLFQLICTFIFFNTSTSDVPQKEPLTLVKKCRVKNYPYFAVLETLTSNLRWKAFCGIAFLGPKWVLTSISCCEQYHIRTLRVSLKIREKKFRGGPDDDEEYDDDDSYYLEEDNPDDNSEDNLEDKSDNSRLTNSNPINPNLINSNPINSNPINRNPKLINSKIIEPIPSPIPKNFTSVILEYDTFPDETDIPGFGICLLKLNNSFPETNTLRYITLRNPGEPLEQICKDSPGVVLKFTKSIDHGIFNLKCFPVAFLNPGQCSKDPICNFKERNLRESMPFHFGSIVCKNFLIGIISNKMKNLKGFINLGYFSNFINETMFGPKKTPIKKVVDVVPRSKFKFTSAKCATATNNRHYVSISKLTKRQETPEHIEEIYNHNCAGSLLKSTWVLTASQCCTYGSEYNVVAGGFEMNKKQKAFLLIKTSQKSKVKKMFLPTDSKLGVCLMELATPLNQTASVGFIKPVYFKNSSKGGSGGGQDTEGGDKSKEKDPQLCDTALYLGFSEEAFLVFKRPEERHDEKSKGGKKIEDENGKKEGLSGKDVEKMGFVGKGLEKKGFEGNGSVEKLPEKLHIPQEFSGGNTREETVECFYSFAVNPETCSKDVEGYMKQFCFLEESQASKLCTDNDGSPLVCDGKLFGLLSKVEGCSDEFVHAHFLELNQFKHFLEATMGSKTVTTQAYVKHWEEQHKQFSGCCKIRIFQKIFQILQCFILINFVLYRLF